MKAPTRKSMMIVNHHTNEVDDCQQVVEFLFLFYFVEPVLIFIVNNIVNGES
jgi:hypothetical protein